MQNMAMKPVLKSNLSIQTAQKNSAKYGNERRSKEQFKHSDSQKNAKYDNENCSKEQFKHSDGQN